MELLFKKLDPKADLPVYATAGAAGMDLHACLETPLELAPGAAAPVPTGLAAAIPEGYVGLVCARSGLAVKHGVTLSNGVGVIDSDYRGEIKVGLVNLGRETYAIGPGERVAQMLLVPVARPALGETHRLPETHRGAGGFGSTGK